MYSVEKNNKPEDTTTIGRESTLILRGVEKACHESRRKDRERSRATVVFLSAGRVKPKEGRGLGVNDIAIRTVDII